MTHRRRIGVGRAIPSRRLSALPTRAALRAEAEVVYRRQLADLAGLARLMLDGVEPARAAHRAGRPFGPDDVRALDRYAEHERHFVEVAGFTVASCAVLTGRWPEAREAEALARCADVDGLFAFMDAMDMVPVGFVDPPEAGGAPQ